MSDHDPITELDLLAHADGRLDSARAAAVERYLARHPALRAQVEDFARQNDELHACFDRYAEAPLPPRMAAMLTRGTGSRSRWVRRVPRVAAAAAAAVVLMVGGWTAGRLTVPAERAPEISSVAARDAVRPAAVDAGGEADAFAPMRRDLAVGLHAPDLRRQGYDLAGKRAVDVDGRPGVLLRYVGTGGRALEVVMHTRWRRGEASLDVADTGDGTVASWRDGPVRVAVRGAADAAEIRRIAGSLRTALRSEPGRDGGRVTPQEPVTGVGVNAAEDSDRPVIAPSIDPQPATMNDS